MKNDAEAPLFPNEYREFMSEEWLSEILKEIARDAGIKKKIHPYILRHSRITHMCRKLSDSAILRLYGIKSRKTLQRYDHLRVEEAEEELLKLYGIKEEEEPPQLRPRICPRCKAINTPLSKYCRRCGMIIDEKEALEHEQLAQALEILLSDPTVRQKFKEKLKSILS